MLVIGLLEDQDQTGSLSASTDENVNNNIITLNNLGKKRVIKANPLVYINKLINDLTLLADRFNKLDKHFDLARKDLDDIKISHRKIESRGQVITSIEIDEKKKLQ